MARPAQGGTVRPSLARPGNGYSRGTGRPEPWFTVAPAALPEPEWFNDESLAPAAPPDRTPASVFRRLLGQS
jgi:hypothetical protein